MFGKQGSGGVNVFVLEKMRNNTREYKGVISDIDSYIVGEFGSIKNEKTPELRGGFDKTLQFWV